MRIGPGASVALRYRLFDGEGRLVESSDEVGLMEYEHGAGDVLPALAARMEGERVGSHCRVELDPVDAFGLYDPERLIEVPRAAIAGGTELRRGDWVPIRVEDDATEVSSETNELEARVVEVSPESVVLDANHPLAGQRVVFEIEVMRVAPGPA